MHIDKNTNTVTYFDNGMKTIKLTDEQMKKLPRNITDVTFKILLDSDFDLTKPVKLKTTTAVELYNANGKAKTINNVKRLESLKFGSSPAELKIINLYENKFKENISKLKNNNVAINIYNEVNSIDYKTDYNSSVKHPEVIEGKTCEQIDRTNFEDYIKKYILENKLIDSNLRDKIGKMKEKFILVRKVKKTDDKLGKKIYVYNPEFKKTFNLTENFMQLPKFIICYTDWINNSVIILNSSLSSILRGKQLKFICENQFGYYVDGMVIQYDKDELDTELLESVEQVTKTEIINEAWNTEQTFESNRLLTSSGKYISGRSFFTLCFNVESDDDILNNLKTYLLHNLFNNERFMQTVKSVEDNELTNRAQMIWDGQIQNWIDEIEDKSKAANKDHALKVIRKFYDDYIEKLQTIFESKFWNFILERNRKRPYIYFMMTENKLNKTPKELAKELIDGNPVAREYFETKAKDYKKTGKELGKNIKDLEETEKELEKNEEEINELEKQLEKLEESKMKVSEEITEAKKKEEPEVEEDKTKEVKEEKLIEKKAGLQEDLLREILNELKKLNSVHKTEEVHKAPENIPMPSIPSIQQSNLEEAIRNLKHIDQVPVIEELPSDDEVNSIKYQIENFDKSKLKKYSGSLNNFNHLHYYYYQSENNDKDIENFIKLNPGLTKTLLDYDRMNINLVNAGLKDKILNSIPGVSTIYQAFKTVWPIIRPVAQKLHEKFDESFNKKAETDKDLNKVEVGGMITRDRLDKFVKEDIHMKPLSEFGKILSSE